MNTHDAIKLTIDTGNMISMGYLQDLTDQELLHRPDPGCNHINWQIGHLIVSDNGLVGKVAPGAIPALPAGFADKYSAKTANVDDPKQLCTKAELMQVYEEQRQAALAAFDKLSDADFDKPSGIEFAPTAGSVFALLGSHWLMHAGQWAVVRRQLGRKPLF